MSSWKGKRMAEREGFEPPVPAKVRLISSQVHSTGLCHLSDSFQSIANDAAGKVLYCGETQ